MILNVYFNESNKKASDSLIIMDEAQWDVSYQ